MSLELDNEDRPLDTGCIVNGNTRPMGLMAAELDLQCPTTSSMPSGPPGIQQVFTKPLADSDIPIDDPGVTACTVLGRKITKYQ